MLKPFDLQLAKQGHEVRTRNGQRVKLLSTDRKGQCPIIGLRGENERMCSWDKYGRYVNNNHNSAYDLLLWEDDPVVHELWGVAYCKGGVWKIHPHAFPSQQQAEGYAQSIVEKHVVSKLYEYTD